MIVAVPTAPSYEVTEPATFDTVLPFRVQVDATQMAELYFSGTTAAFVLHGNTYDFFQVSGSHAPQYGTLATVPFLPEVTTDIAYFRLHGRNREAWLKKGVETSERYDYLYSIAELRDFAATAKNFSKRAKTVFVMFNNCRAGHAMKNALEILRLLG